MTAATQNSPPHSADTFTFVFTDIEGSTRKWEEFPDAMRDALDHHDALLHRAVQTHGGHVFKTVGDAFCAAFSEAPAAARAAAQFQEKLARQTWGALGSLRVRVGLHAGPAHRRAGDYFGPTLNRVARLQSIGHGGQTLLSQSAATLTRDALPDGAWLKDLGSHRLKDLGRPEHIFQLCLPGLPEDFPPVRSLQAFANNLPLQMTSFVGRQPEITRLKELMAQHRLVTLTGAGGTGKTRLALQAAAERLEQYSDGVWFIELASLSDAALVVPTLATVLGVQEESSRPLPEILSELLRPQKTLLVLDNCEHLLGACASLAEALLQACPGVSVLATGREALGIAGEQVWQVPALSLPDPNGLPTAEKDLGAALLEYDAVRLFVERARAQRADFVLGRGNARAVTQICTRLDGIPLALELAAARVRVLSAEQIAARLDDRFLLLTGGSRTALPRHQTLRALMDWSYELLGTSEQVLLQRLSVFAGGWSLEAAESVCAGEPLAAEQLLDLLASLSDKSLAVYQEEENAGRYRLLETVREYASERLTESGSGAGVESRHRAYFSALAEKAVPRLSGPEQAEWLTHLEGEHDNLGAALTRFEKAAGSPGPDESAEATAWLRLCAALGRFWNMRGHFSEGRQWLEKALRQTGGSSASTARARALNWAGNLAWGQGDLGAARSRYQESLSQCRLLDDREGIAGSLNNLGNVASAQGDYLAAREHYTGSLEIKRLLRDQQGIANSLGNLGNLASEEGDYDAARACYGESLEIFRRLGHRQGIADNLGNLGVVAWEQGDYPAARALFVESLAIKRLLGDQQGIADALEGLADVEASEGQAAQGAWLWGVAAALREQIGAQGTPLERERQEQGMEQARQALGAAAFDAAYSEGLALTWERAIEEALETPS